MSNFNGGTFTGNNAALTGAADWTAGTFSGSWGVNAAATLNVTTGNNKLMNAATFANDGTVNWSAGNLFLANDSQITNNGLWDASGNNSLNPNGGVTSGFTNDGTFRKSGGLGTTTINGIAFTNNGTIDAQTGSIDFNGGNATFNAGSAFTGGGEVNINSNAAFNGGFTSTNLDFNGGTFTGTGAVLTGAADWTAGTFSGDWEVTAGATLTALTGNNKFFNAADFTNSGTIDWTGGNSFFANGSQLINNGLIDFAASSSLNNNGGAVSTITNGPSGVLHADVGATVTMANTFVNNGGAITADGTFAFNGGNATFNTGTAFGGTGTNAINSSAAFNGAISSTNLDFNGGTFTGTGAVLTGAADWTAGTFSGDWEVTAGATLTALTGNNKFFNAADFTNSGTIDWTGGNSFFANGSQLINNGLIDFAASSSLNNNGGAVSTITNGPSGVLHADVGATVTMANTFVNNGGAITADGTFAFNGGNATFNTGTAFGGTGTNAINSSAAFNGAISSTNLDFNGGTFTGNAAALTGAADWTAGTFSGSWGVNAGATLNVTTGNNKFFNGADFTNNGTVNWSAGNLFLSNASQIVNTGTIAITSNNSINNNGGAASSIVNNGLIEKTAGSGTSTLANGIGLDNNGTINVLSGTIALPGAFSNDGTLGGTGIFTSSTLTNNGSIAPGAPGTTGTLSLTGAFIQGALGSLNAQLASTALSDLFNISGSASLNGTLALSCIFGCAINDGDSFVLLDSIGALSGTFSNITTAGFLNGFAYNVIYDYGNDQVRLDIIDAGSANPAVPEPGTWAMMIFGFGVVGSAIRRRKTATPAVA